MSSQSEFIQNYSKVVARTWVDDSFLNELLDNPKATLDENGLTTPEGADVQIVTVPAGETGSGSIEGQYSRWEAGEESGTYELHISLKPDDFDPENVNLSESQLDAVAGGLLDGCCCCTPCCCCT